MQLKQKKLVRFVVGILLIFILLYMLALFAASIYITSNKEKIIGDIRKSLTENVKGKISVGSIDISVWRSFPKIAISLHNISITDSLYNKPILRMGTVSARAGLFSLLGKTITISSVELDNGFLHLFTDSSGYSNSYLLAPKKTNPSAKGKKLFIDNVTLNKVQVLIENVALQKMFELRFTNVDADLKNKSDSVINIKLQEDCIVKGLGFDLSKGSYLNDQTIAANWNIHLNTKNISLSFDKTKAEINDHPFDISGAFFLKDSSHFLLNISTKQLLLDNARQLVPNNIQRILHLFQISQPLDVLATIQGPMAPKTTPLVNIIWSVKNTTLATKVVGFANCGFNGLFTNQLDKNLPLSDANSEILLSNFSGDLGAIKLFSKNIIVTNIDSPIIEFGMQSNCSFPQLDTTLALNNVHFISGDASLHILYKGPLINDISIIDKLNLDLNFKNGLIEYVPRNFTLNNFNGDILIGQNNLKGGNFQCDFKQSHFQVNVTGTELSKLSDTIQGKANIYCSVSSSSCNLEDFITLFSPKIKVQDKANSHQSFAGTALQLDNILQNGNLHVSIKADKIYLDNFQATNVSANLLFEENDWQVQNASLNQSGGSFNISAKVLELNNGYHQSTASFNIQNADVKKVFYSFNNFGQQGISYQNLKGNLSAAGNICVGVNSNGKVVKNTMSGNLFFSLKKGALINYTPIEQIKTSVLKNIDLSNIEFAELKDSLDINNAGIYIHRMAIESSALTCFVQGIYSLENKTDISIQVPLSNLKKKPENFVPSNISDDAKVGPSLYFRAQSDKNGQIKLSLDVFGKLRGDNLKK